MATIFDVTYRDSEGYAEITSAHYDNGEFVIDEQKWFEYPTQEDELLEYIEQNADKNVYFSTSLMSERKRGKATASAINAVYVDADKCAPENFLVEPSVIVTTSPGNYQLYWAVDEELSPLLASDIAHRMCKAHREQGCDPSGWTPAKIMRVPGTTHSKTETHFEVLVEYTGILYTKEELIEAYKHVEVDDVVEYASRPLPADLPLVDEVVTKIFDDETLSLYLKEPSETDDWSVLRWKLSNDLFRQGFAAEEVFVLVKNTSFNKYARDGRPDEHLWAEILKSEATVLNEGTAAHEVAGDIKLPELPQEVLDTTFLTEEEREALPNCFLDEFQAWVAGLSPLALPKFARFAGVMLLANIYGSYAYIKPQFGVMHLNLWGLLLGESSTTKKSTVRKLMSLVLEAWERRTGTLITIGNDFTSEGLNASLAERDRQTSFVWRDEVQGFFMEIFKKGYMAGAKERMTDLYDGTVAVTMRASKASGQDKRVTPIFNFLGMGIEDKVTEILTSDDFASGFLARPIWCVGESREWNPDDEWVGEAEGDDRMSEDTQITEFCNQFNLAKRAWYKGRESRELNADGVEVPISYRIRTSPEALRRWNLWKVDTGRLIQSADRQESLKPGRERIVYSVWKLAALLAIHERSSEITLNHMLLAIREAEGWFADMVKMAGRVASNDYKRQVDKIYAYIASSSKVVPRRTVYRKFDTLRKSEVDEYLNALISQGVVTVSVEGFKA